MLEAKRYWMLDILRIERLLSDLPPGLSLRVFDCGDG
jgi:hypothetical protein